MALQQLARSVLLSARAFPLLSGDITTAIMDAAGESTTYIGKMYLSSGRNTSKVLSAAGSGKIHVAFASVTFANAGTTIRVGAQDVTAGLEDGTFDVHGDLVGGTDTITSDVIKTVTMGSGTKTIADGDRVAISIEAISRAGADTLRPYRMAASTNFPYCTTDTGSGPAKATSYPMVIVEFDDGTIGTFGHFSTLYISSTTAFGSGSSPNEYALLFSLPVPYQVSGLAAFIGDIDSGDNGELLLYSDPTGTPAVIGTATIDADANGVTANLTGPSEYPLDSGATVDLTANTTYAVAYRPSAAGTRNLGFITIPSANARRAFTFGTTAQGGSRTTSGAFGSLSSTVLPLLGIVVSAFDDGAGGSSTVVMVEDEDVMSDERKHSTASNIVRARMRHATTGAGLTGLTSASAGLILSTICDNEATVTRYRASSSEIETITTLGTFAAPTSGKCRFKEVDATNDPGLYEIQLADARFAVAGARRLRITWSGATNLLAGGKVITLTAFDPFDAVRMGMTALPNAAADAAGGLPISDAGGLDMDGVAAAAAAATLAGVDDSSEVAAQVLSAADSDPIAARLAPVRSV